MRKEQISVSHNTAYGDLIFTVRTTINFTKEFVSIQNIYKINTVFKDMD